MPATSMAAVRLDLALSLLGTLKVIVFGSSL